MKNISIKALLILVSLSFQAMANQEPPATLNPSNLVAEMISKVKERILGGSSKAEIRQVFQEEVTQHLAYATLTRWIAGDRWDGLPQNEREMLSEVVIHHVGRSYGTLLTNAVRAEVLINKDSRVSGRKAIVSALAKIPNEPDKAVEFHLVSEAGAWKLIDVKFDGISFAKTIRAELRPLVLNSHEALAAYLADHSSP
ncbi:MAG: ABC transporter substrate-binding protein [Pseudomonadota bacterium]